MNADLKATLKELGPEYRSVVRRLRRGYEPAETGGGLSLPWGRLGLAAACLTAASFALCLAVGLLGGDSAAVLPRGAAVYTAACAPDGARVRSILADQRPDGSWTTDFLTRQNAAALEACDDEAARVAYRRAVRYLRRKGLAPLSETELRGYIAAFNSRHG